MKLRSFKKEQQKNEKEIVSVDGVFFDNSQQFINLKKKQPFIEIHFKVFINFIDHFKVPIGIVLITFISLAFLGSVFVSKANVATFYPDTCLGGWDNPLYASGKADLDSTAKLEDFTKGNSALIKGASEIYCGGFKGEIPTDTSPKNFVLSFSWSIDDGSIIHNDTQPIESNISIPDSKTPEVIETPENTNESVPETPISDTPTPEPQSFLDKFIPKVYAQELETPTPPKEDTPTVTPDSQTPPDSSNTVVEDNTPPPTEEKNNENTYLLTTEPDASVMPEDSNNNSDNTNVPVSLDVSTQTEEPTDSFMEVLYTLDGTTWNSLGKIGRNNWQNISFDIPLVSWDDLAQFQIELKPIQTIDTYPTIYLDAMILSVEYESEAKVDVKEAQPIYEITNIQNTGTKIVLSNEGTILSPDQILITSDNDVLGGIAVYNKDTDTILLTTNVGQKTYPLDLSYFGEGNYTVINTKDPDFCSARKLSECLSANDFIGSATFSVKNKNAPPETNSETPVNNSNTSVDNSADLSIPVIPSETPVESIPSTVLDLLNIPDPNTENSKEDSKDTESGGIVLPPVDTESGEAVSF